MEIVIRDTGIPAYEWSWIYGSKTVNMQAKYSGYMPYHREVLTFMETPSLGDVIARIKSWVEEQE